MPVILSETFRLCLQAVLIYTMLAPLVRNTDWKVRRAHVISYTSIAPERWKGSVDHGIPWLRHTHRGCRMGSISHVSPSRQLGGYCDRLDSAHHDDCRLLHDHRTLPMGTTGETTARHHLYDCWPRLYRRSGMDVLWRLAVWAIGMCMSVALFHTSSMLVL